MNIEAFFKISYGLYVVSTSHAGKLNGFVSNTVFQVTAEPPQFAIACSKNNFTAQMLVQSGFAAISVLSKDAKSEIFGTFGYKSGKNIEKFTDFNYKTGESGVPILLDDCVAWFECKILQAIDAGTHLIFIAEIIDNEIIDYTKEPLTYSYYREVKKGKAPKNAPTYIDPQKLKKI